MAQETVAPLESRAAGRLHSNPLRPVDPAGIPQKFGLVTQKFDEICNSPRLGCRNAASSGRVAHFADTR